MEGVPSGGGARMTPPENHGTGPGQDFCSLLASRVERCGDLPPLLRTAFVSALRGEPAYASVQELAAGVHRDRRTLYYHFGRTRLARRGVTLKECVDWFLLARAVDRKLADLSWKSVAAALGVEISHLSRLCKRLTGRTLSELDADGFELLRSRLESWIGG